MITGLLAERPGPALGCGDCKETCELGRGDCEGSSTKPGCSIISSDSKSAPTGPRRAQDRSELLRPWRGPSLRTELPEGMGIESAGCSEFGTGRDCFETSRAKPDSRVTLGFGSTGIIAPGSSMWDALWLSTVARFFFSRLQSWPTSTKLGIAGGPEWPLVTGALLALLRSKGCGTSMCKAWMAKL